MSEITSEELNSIIKSHLDPRRYEHTLRVLDMALEMGKIFDADSEKIRIAALFHDYCKDGSRESNALSHAGEAADILKYRYGVIDEDILNAVRYHTTGRKDMSTLELIIFLADTLEYGRTYDGVNDLRKEAYADLHACCLNVLKELKIYLEKNDLAMTRDSIEAIEWLETIKKGEGIERSNT